MPVGPRYSGAPRGTSLGELARAQPAFRRLKIIDTCYTLAEEGSVKHAELLARLMGELAANVAVVAVDSPMMQAIEGLRAAMQLPPLLGDPHTTDAGAIDAESQVIDPPPAES